ncbi:DUF4097 family beta strand repeat-containing protein [Dactylosporangium sp. NBC_01737]|uniref:DUF4097 family beta strand repeat-containing protein n=1 Tax=Dactylosporangium sp. NBC_01737 TaxID=2975959 RepID=UPI002E0DCEA2|nr:DUF4097 family beta strand repeat-containing protein [Dactylosporangium sp. NBC_01737]
MPSFDTPEPISVTLEFDIGFARVVGGARTDTVVEVLPTNGAEDADVRAAQETRVTYNGGALLVKGARKRSLFGRPGSVDIVVEVPAGSDVRGTTALGDISCEGRLGECRIRTAAGAIHVEEAAAVHLRSSYGDIRVRRVGHDADVTGAGQIEVGTVGGAAAVKNGNGDTTIGEIAGELQVSASNGGITVGVAHAGVEAKSAFGSIRVGDVARGRALLRTAAGDVEVGIRGTTAAWLDVHTSLGSIRNSLTPSDGPGEGKETVEVRARTSLGDIIVRRPDAGVTGTAAAAKGQR